jgi:hypothetical protein
VLCDGLGTVQEVGGGERQVICPSCGGTNIARCLATGCEGGRIACADCAGAGSRPCHHCSGAGRVAKATVVSRTAKVGRGTSWVELGLPQMVLDGLEALSEPGNVEATAVIEGLPEGVDYRLVPFLQRAEDQAAREVHPGSSSWRPTRRDLELRRVEVWQVTYTSIEGEHPVWLIGEARAAVGETTPVGAWRKGVLDRVERLALAGDAVGLHRTHLDEAFDPGDDRVAELGQRLSVDLTARWNRGEVALARRLRDAAPKPLAPVLREALAPLEAQFGAQVAQRHRRRFGLACVLGFAPATALAPSLGLSPELALGSMLAGAALAYLPVRAWHRWQVERSRPTLAPLLAAAWLPSVAVGVALASLPARASCNLLGSWQGGVAGNAVAHFTFEAGASVEGKLRLPGGPETGIELSGSCDPSTRRFALKGALGTLSGHLSPEGNALEASWAATGSPGKPAPLSLVRVGSAKQPPKPR